MTDAMNMSAFVRYFAAVATALLILASDPLRASAQGVSGMNLIILLRLTGESGTVPQLRSCLTASLSQMPDVEIVTKQIDGVRLIVDIIAERGANDHVFASLMVAETFPMEQRVVPQCQEFVG